jgi:hypothetical protein
MFGTYSFSYQPSSENPEGEPSFSMTFPGDADLKTMVGHFENFLRASGYPLDFDEELVVISAQKGEKHLKKLISEKV